MVEKHSTGRAAPLVLAIVLLLGPVASGAQNFGGGRPEERYFRIESEPVQSAGGRAVVRGHISNIHDTGARNVRLLIEGLDGSGQTVSATVAWVNGDVSPGGRRYFEAVAPTPGTTFRVTVLYYDWVPGGGGVGR